MCSRQELSQQFYINKLSEVDALTDKNINILGMEIVEKFPLKVEKNATTLDCWSFATDGRVYGFSKGQVKIYPLKVWVKLNDCGVFQSILARDFNRAVMLKRNKSATYYAQLLDIHLNNSHGMYHHNELQETIDELRETKGAKAEQQTT